MKRDRIINIRVTLEEKEEIKRIATKNGFNSITAYLLWLFRKFGENR